MKAWLMKDYGGIEKLQLEQVPDPEPQAGEAILAVEYAGLNPADRYLAERQYPAKPKLPHILGRDGIGTVIAVGAGVKEVSVGDRRAILRGETGVNLPGTLAERVAVPVQDLVEIPKGWSDEEAAGASLVYLTAYQSLTMWGSLPPAALVLVTGASGGVGVASIQLALAMGYTVVGLSRSAEKGERLKQIGAQVILDPGDKDWRRKLKELLAPRRVDLAIDNIGGTLFNELLETLGDQAKVSVVGRLAGPVPEFNTAALFFRRIRIGGVTVAAYKSADGRAAWNQILQLLSCTGARPLVDRVFPLEEAQRAFGRLSEGPLGKVLVKIRQ